MERAYCERCAYYGHKAKVFTKRHKNLSCVFGCPDLCILFTNTVSHNMVQIASETARKRKVPLARCHSSSLASLDVLLKGYSTSSR